MNANERKCFIRVYWRSFAAMGYPASGRDVEQGGTAQRNAE
jgi:hypothetical protein